MRLLREYIRELHEATDEYNDKFKILLNAGQFKQAFELGKALGMETKDLPWDPDSVRGYYLAMAAGKESMHATKEKEKELEAIQTVINDVGLKDEHEFYRAFGFKRNDYQVSKAKKEIESGRRAPIVNTAESALRHLVRNLLVEQDELGVMSIDEVQSIVDRVFPEIVQDRTAPPQGVPKVELHKDIYARHSDIEGMEGELSHSSKAEFVDENNAIYVYFPNMVSEEDVIRSLLHEFEHAHQDPKEYEDFREQGFDGQNNPLEVKAFAAEEKWEKYLVAAAGGIP